MVEKDGDVPLGSNPIALRKTKIAYNFGLSWCDRVKKYLDSYCPPLMVTQRCIIFHEETRKDEIFKTLPMVIDTPTPIGGSEKHVLLLKA